MAINGFRSLLGLLRGSHYDGDLFTVIKGAQRDYKPKTQGEQSRMCEGQHLTQTHKGKANGF